MTLSLHLLPQAFDLERQLLPLEVLEIMRWKSLTHWICDIVLDLDNDRPD